MSAPPQEIGPWRRVPMPLLGGVTAVGFSESEGHLLVVSHTGRGVVDLATGERVARDAGGGGTGATRPGIGPIEGEAVRIVGDGVGAPFATTTADGWQVSVDRSQRTVHAVTLANPAEGEEQQVWRWDPPFACGFSPSGAMLIVACSNTVEMWRR